MSSNVHWLSEAEENRLHAIRLLKIEQRPFERVYKRLTQPDSLIVKRGKLPTPPPEDPNDVSKDEETLEREEQERAQWREDMLLDFAALESSMVRIQLLQKSNERERERYAAEKLRIIETAEAIKNNTADLRLQLEQAHQTMELRKKYDELANKIFSNKMLKSREEQVQMHEKLQKEIAEQEQEAEEFAKAVEARKEQYFGAVKVALKGMKAIQHPEQAHDDEMKDDEDESGRDGSRAASRSRSGTREHTPMGNEHGEGGGGDSLKPPPGLHSGSQAPSPAAETQETKEDVEMGEVSTPLESVEEGEASESNDLMED